MTVFMSCHCSIVKHYVHWPLSHHEISFVSGRFKAVTMDAVIMPTTRATIYLIINRFTQSILGSWSSVACGPTVTQMLSL